MKKVLLLLFFMVVPMMTMLAVLPKEPICLQPKDNPEIDNPIKRSPMRTPIIGIEGTKLVRLQAATNLFYYIEVLQDGEVVYSSNSKRKISKKLFGEELTPKDFDAKIHKML